MTRFSGAARWRRWTYASVLTGALMVGLSGPQQLDAAVAGAVPTKAGSPAASSGLLDPQPCADQPGFSCGHLAVPLDRSGRVPGTLRLKVAVSDNVDAPRGVLLVLTGGPGQPGVPYVQSMVAALPEVAREYRLVMIDQRGTGGPAIDCPDLQQQVGSSDVAAATPEAIRDCAGSLGAARPFYTTADTVADLDALRRALRVGSWVLDGVSYGTFVAQRYALTYPRRADRLVLDSVVTQDNADPLYVPAMARSAWVLRKACQEQSCPSDDPAEDLAVTLRRHGDGVRALDALIILSIIDPKLTSPDFAVLDRLRQAAAGNPAPWQELLGWFSPGDSTPKEEFSAGLHLATLCPDFTDLPWGDSSAPMRGRDQAVRRAVATLPPGSVWPFQPRTAGEQGFIANCKQWPPTRPNPAPPHHRLTMPVLLLAGDRDLSTPLQWAEDQLARTPRGELVVIKGAGHSVQRRSPAGALAVTDFLLH